MKILLDFAGQTIELPVVLIDNAAVQDWAKHFSSKDLRPTAQLYYKSKQYEVLPEDLDLWLRKCKKSQRKLHKLGFPFNAQMPDSVTDITRQWCNELHRYFTHTQQAINSGHIEHRLTDYCTDLCMTINELVHRIEATLLPAVHDPLVKSLRSIYISYEPKYDDPHWWHMKPEWRQYHSKTHADVILGPQILGKSLLTSYLNQDDPNDWDTTGHYVNNGCLQIFQTDVRQQIYGSRHFQQWLGRHGMSETSAWYDFPIGNIPDRSVLDLAFQMFQQLGPESRITTRYVF